MLKLTMMQSGVVNTVLILLKRFIFYFMWLYVHLWNGMLLKFIFLRYFWIVTVTRKNMSIIST